MRQVAAACLLGLSALPAAAQTAAPAAARLADLSLEQLREVVVSTVSRVEQRLDRVAASAYVISADDIRRSGGATTIPSQAQDALEASVKAAFLFLYEFLAYLDWPPSTFAGGDAPHVIGVMGAEAVLASCANWSRAVPRRAGRWSFAGWPIRSRACMSSTSAAASGQRRSHRRSP